MRLSIDQAQTFMQGYPTIDVQIVNVKGSAPREVGAWMLVNETDMIGTIGGGQLEYMMIDEARKMLRHDTPEKTVTVPLGPEIGQCCGGQVELSLSKIVDIDSVLARLESEHAREPEVLIFGAGHVGKALAKALTLLPVKPILIDQRAHELPIYENVETRLSPLPEAEIRSAKPGSAIVVLTHDHALDFLISGEALARGDFAYVGMIGSKTKRAVFSSWLGEAYDAKISANELVCPIGGEVSTDKRPEIIAALVVAQIITALYPIEQSGALEELKGAQHAE
ncbi:xanthine dehydrogenase accessory protein XdhC [Maritalea sp.]|uniref:xanthine dehydrogenase accessory protein XdhC n=1 Tax=Maritalea sp. TaxID=2003361 RepID=UPI003EF53C7A